MEDARALPFSAYSDPNVMNLELDRIFRREWIAVCPEIALSAKGDYTTIEIAGEPIAVVRGQDGELRALSNVCRHRGSPLLEGTGNLSANIVCPYHAWAYDDRGEMKGAPQTGAVVIDRAAHCLPTFRLEVWSGIVFVNLDAEAEPLARRLSGIEKYRKNVDAESHTHAKPLTEEPWRWNCNWKMAYENGSENYHLSMVHPVSLKDHPTGGGFNLEGSASWTATASRIGDDWGAYHLMVCIRPCFVGVFSANQQIWLSVLPTGAEECLVYGGSLAASDAAAAESNQFFHAFMSEDKEMCEKVQPAMRARKSEGGQLVEMERTIFDFQQYLGAKLFDQTPAKGWSSPRAVEL